MVGLLVFVMLFTIVGCRRAPSPAPAPSPVPAPNVPPDQTPDPYRPPVNPSPYNPNVPPAPNMRPAPPAPAPAPAPTPAPRANNRADDTAERIAQMVTRMENVDRATAVVMGNMALIGIRMEGGNEQQARNRDNAAGQQMKRQIADKVEREFPEISEALVTTDPEITNRIENISRNIQQGRPISESLDEIAQIIRDITPRMGR